MRVRKDAVDLDCDGQRAGNEAMATQRPVVMPGSNQLRLIDSTGISAGPHRNVPLGPGVYGPAQMSGEIIAVVESSADTRTSL